MTVCRRWLMVFQKNTIFPMQSSCFTDDSYCLNTWNTAAVATHECMYLYIRQRVDWN